MIFQPRNKPWLYPRSSTIICHHLVPVQNYLLMYVFLAFCIDHTSSLKMSRLYIMPFPNFSIDATFSHGLGRLVNDIQPAMANCQMRKILTGGEVYLCLFAIKNIPATTELRYDYGVSDLPWRKTGKSGNNNYALCNKERG